jgi:hypothetical protein
MNEVVFVAPTLAEQALVRAGAQYAFPGQIQVLACGIGPEAAAAFARRLEAWPERPKSLALIGWAGGLSPDLAPGDVVLADRALDEQGEPVPCSVMNLPGAKTGALLTVSAPLLTPLAKQRRLDSAAHASDLLAVEMEAYPLAQWAWQRQAPFVHARVILDAADEALPDLVDALDRLGRIRPGRLARRLLQRPGLSIALFRLVLRAQRLGPILTRVSHAMARMAVDKASW